MGNFYKFVGLARIIYFILMNDIEGILEELRAFNNARDWDKFQHALQSPAHPGAEAHHPRRYQGPACTF